MLVIFVLFRSEKKKKTTTMTKSEPICSQRWSLSSFLLFRSFASLRYLTCNTEQKQRACNRVENLEKKEKKKKKKKKRRETRRSAFFYFSLTIRETFTSHQHINKFFFLSLSPFQSSSVHIKTCFQSLFNDNEDFLRYSSLHFSSLSESNTKIRRLVH